MYNIYQTIINNNDSLCYKESHMTIQIAIANQKGGVGKTTTALALADQLQVRGKRVLLIDCDPQRNSSTVYRAKIDNTATLYDIMMSDYKASQCIQHTDYGDIIACDTMLRNADTEVKGGRSKYTRLQKAVNGVLSNYDFVIYDTPPHSGILLENVLMATDYLVCPIQCDSYSIHGIQDFRETISEYFDENPRLKILGLLKNRYKGRQSLTRSLEEETLPLIAEQIGTTVFKATIRDSVKSAEAAALGIPLSKYKEAKAIAEDYGQLTDEILSMIGEK